MLWPKRHAAQHALSRCPVALFAQLDVGTVGAPRPLERDGTDTARSACRLQAEGAHREHGDGIDHAVDATDGQVPALRHLKRDALAVEARSPARAIRKTSHNPGEGEGGRDDSAHTVSTKRNLHEVHDQAPDSYRQLATTLPLARVVSRSVADPFMPSPMVTTPLPRCGTRAATRTPWLVHTTVRPTPSTPGRKTTRWPPFRLGGAMVDPLAAPTHTVAAATTTAAICATPLIVMLIRHRPAPRHTDKMQPRAPCRHSA